MSKWAKNVACINRPKQFLIMRNWAENIFGLVYAKKNILGPVWHVSQVRREEISMGS